MEIWDDNEFPLAYFITFRTYGSWLHGDERGSIDRYHNIFKGPRVPENPALKKQHETKLKSGHVTLNAAQRKAVGDSIQETCEYRCWGLRAINIRTNHAHVVVSAATTPGRILKDIKAYSTRLLRSLGLWDFEHSPWAEGGSKRYLWKEINVWNACDYVLNGQGRDLPESF